MSTCTAVLLLADVRPASRVWGWSRFVLGSLPLAGVPGLAFARQLGSGHEGGFGLKPSASRQGLFCLFDDEASARAFFTGRTVEGYRARAAEFALLLLRPTSCRGRWAGYAPPVVPPALRVRAQDIGARTGPGTAPGGAGHDAGVAAPAAPTAAPVPVAALTRASIHPRRALAFWRHAPASQAQLERAPGCRLAVGLGEAPLLRQATFSVWDSVAAMEAYARGAAHGQAIRAAAAQGFFSEAMFMRFVPLAMQGAWKGRTLG